MRGSSTLATWPESEVVTLPAGTFVQKTTFEAQLFNSAKPERAVDGVAVPFASMRIPSRSEYKMQADGALLTLSIRILNAALRTMSGNAVPTTAWSPPPQPSSSSNANVDDASAGSSQSSSASRSPTVRRRVTRTERSMSLVDSREKERLTASPPRATSPRARLATMPSSSSSSTAGVAMQAQQQQPLPQPLSLQRVANIALTDAASSTASSSRARSPPVTRQSPRSRSPPPPSLSPLPQQQHHHHHHRRARSKSPRSKSPRARSPREKSPVIRSARSPSPERPRASTATTSTATATSSSSIAVTGSTSAADASLLTPSQEKLLRDELLRTRRELEARFQFEIELLKASLERERRLLQETERTLHERLIDNASLRNQLLVATLETQQQRPLTTTQTQLATSGMSDNAVSDVGGGATSTTIGEDYAQALSDVGARIAAGMPSRSALSDRLLTAAERLLLTREHVVMQLARVYVWLARIRRLTRDQKATYELALNDLGSTYVSFAPIFVAYSPLICRLAE